MYKFLFVFLFAINISYGAMPPYDEHIMPDEVVLMKQSAYQEPSTHLTYNFDMPVLAIDFPDFPHQRNQTQIEQLFFGDTNSANHFYYENSLGLYSFITTSPVVWITAPRNKTYYTNLTYGVGYPNVSLLLVDLQDTIDQLIDFSKYDADNNGECDGICIIAAGAGAEYTGNRNDIWSHRGFSTGFTSDEGISVKKYIITPEYYVDTTDWPLGPIVHEMGHLYGGLPDLYDKDGSSFGVGNASTMAHGSWGGVRGSQPAHLDPYSKERMGMLEYQTITTNGSVVIEPYELTNHCIRLPFSLTEYFLLINVKLIGYNQSNISDGLFIFHVDELQNSNQNEWTPDNQAGHYLVAIEQADGLFDMERKVNYGEPKDIYKNGNELTFWTMPSSQNYDGTKWMTINGINVSTNIICNVVVDQNTNVNDDQDITFNRQLNISGGAGIRIESVDFEGDINIYNVLGQKIFANKIVQNGVITLDGLVSGRYFVQTNQTVKMVTVIK